MKRYLVSLSLVALACLSIGVATAWMSDSGELRYTITVADDTTEDLVWICKLAGPPAEPTLAPGKNPLQVSTSSVDAQDAFSDSHPSYVVESGDVVCIEPTGENEAASDS